MVRHRVAAAGAPDVVILMKVLPLVALMFDVILNGTFEFSVPQLRAPLQVAM